MFYTLILFYFKTNIYTLRNWFEINSVMCFCRSSCPCETEATICVRLIRHCVGDLSSDVYDTLGCALGQWSYTSRSQCWLAQRPTLPTHRELCGLFVADRPLQSGRIWYHSRSCWAGHQAPPHGSWSLQWVSFKFLLEFAFKNYFKRKELVSKRA